MADLIITKFDHARMHRHSADEIAAGASPDVRFCFLIDAKQHNSTGLSMGCLVLPMGAELPPHTHRPEEAYFIKKGAGLLHLPDGSTKDITENDAVYIPPNERHGIKNTGQGPLELIWIFPTDSFADVAYHYESATKDKDQIAAGER